MKYKIVVPKAGASNESGTATRLYELNEVVDASEDWLKSIMDAFCANGWAMEIKVVEPEVTATVEDDVKPAPKKRTRKKAAPKAK